MFIYWAIHECQLGRGSVTNIQTAFALITFLGILILLISLFLGFFGHVGEQDADADMDGDLDSSGDMDGHHYHDDHHDSHHYHDDHNDSHHHRFLSTKFLVVSPRIIGLFCATFGGVGLFLVSKVGFFNGGSILDAGEAVLVAVLIAVGIVFIYLREQQLMDSIETECMGPCDLAGKEATVVQRVYPNINGSVAIHEAGQMPKEHLARSCSGEIIQIGEKVLIVGHQLELSVRRLLTYREGVALQDFCRGAEGLIKVQEQELRAILTKGEKFIGKGGKVLIVKDGLVPEIKAC